MFHVKRRIIINHKSSVISYKAIAEAIYKSLKEKEK